MYSSFELAKKYITYYLQASNSKGHGMHSPFVFQFILDVLNNRQQHSPPTAIENCRQQLLQNKSILHVEDFGAGSRSRASKQRRVAQLARTAVKPKKYSHLLYRLVKTYKPETIIELGTSLGITTAYLAAAHTDAEVKTIEGSSAIQEVALRNFKQLGIKNIQSVQGNFDAVLPKVLKNTPQVDLAYIDGNHRYQPTINYFHQFLTKAHSATIMVFDDIHWSPEMERAWEEIKSHPRVTASIDIFFLGFVFFRPQFKQKQHFVIRY